MGAWSNKASRKPGRNRQRLSLPAIRGTWHSALDAETWLATAPAQSDKPGPLTPEERLEIQDHVMIGVRILGPIPGFEKYLPIVREHHEWFNGKGYPHGIAGDNISFLARVLAVADVYDALISGPPYREGMPIRQVEAIIRKESGAQFDPRAVDAFLHLLRKERPSVVQVSQEPVTLGRD